MGENIDPNGANTAPESEAGVELGTPQNFPELQQEPLSTQLQIHHGQPSLLVDIPRRSSDPTPGTQGMAGSLEELRWENRENVEVQVSSSGSSVTQDSGLSSISSTSSSIALDPGFRIIDGGWVYVRRYRKAFEDEETFQRNRIMPLGRRNNDFFSRIFRLRIQHSLEENNAVGTLRPMTFKENVNHSEIAGSVPET